MDFYDSYRFLLNHPMFRDGFCHSLDIEVVKVDPATLCIEKDRTRNTRTQVCLECGPYEEPEYDFVSPWTHDPDLDCGGDTFEEAIVKLAQLVLAKYGTGGKPA